jgi:hypothetical protein
VAQLLSVSIFIFIEINLETIPKVRVRWFIDLDGASGGVLVRIMPNHPAACPWVHGRCTAWLISLFVRLYGSIIGLDPFVYRNAISFRISPPWSTRFTRMHLKLRIVDHCRLNLLKERISPLPPAIYGIAWVHRGSKTFMYVPPREDLENRNPAHFVTRRLSLP